MLTKIQVEAICKELNAEYPSISSKGAVWSIVTLYYKYSDEQELFNQFTDWRDDHYWITTITFLLLVLAAEGVPYDC